MVMIMVITFKLVMPVMALKFLKYRVFLLVNIGISMLVTLYMFV